MLHKSLEKITFDLQEVHSKCEELRNAKQEAVRELLTMQEQHRAEIRISSNTLLEETTARETLERRLCELRTEVCCLFFHQISFYLISFYFPVGTTSD